MKDNPIGLNINAQQNETKDSIDISDSEMEKPEDQYISPAGIPSQKINTNDGLNNETESNNSPSWKSNELLLIDPSNLPDEIISAIGSSLGICHFAIWAPNCLGSLVTVENIIELPPGSTIVLVFPETHLSDLPNDFQIGKSYLIPT